MLSNLGNISLFLAIISIIFANIFGLLFKQKRIALYVIITANILIISSYLCMLILFIQNDMSSVSVIFNSSSIMQLKYRITASWSSHETSMLFWNMLIALVNLIFICHSRFKQYYIYLYSSVIQLFIILIVFLTANPFMKISTIPHEGLGMNPMLQDEGMMIHPPLLYIAYSIYQLIFICTLCGSLFRKNLDYFLQLYSRISLSILTIAIMLGGWWAYRELGWGGYWYFDPVENISLLVWIFGLCFHHVVNMNRLMLSKFIFGILPFLTILFGTYLVRSGTLISVHSFAEAKSSKWIFLLLVLLFITSIFVLLQHAVQKGNKINILFKEKLIISSNIVWSVCSLIIFITLIFPIIFYVLTNEKIEIEPEFFISTLIPILLINASLMLLSFNFNKLNLLIYSTAVIIFPISIFYRSGITIAFAYYLSVCIIMSGITKLLFIINLIRQKIPVQNFLSLSVISMIISHTAAGLLIFSLAWNNHHKKVIDLELNKGIEQKILPGYIIKLDKMEYAAGPNYIKQKAHLNIFHLKNLEENNKSNNSEHIKDNSYNTSKNTKNNNKTNISKEIKIIPELRFYPVENTLIADVGLVHYLFYDWYAVITNVDGDNIGLQLIKHPAISLIWLSCILMGVGIILPLFKREIK